MHTEIFRFIFDMVTDPLSLPINPLYEWAILLIIGEIAYRFAFRTVGDMYDSGEVSGSFLGSLFHWIIRFLIFAAVWLVAYSVIAVGQWIAAHWIIVASAAGTLALAITIVCVTYIIRSAVKS